MRSSCVADNQNVNKVWSTTNASLLVSSAISNVNKVYEINYQQELNTLEVKNAFTMLLQ